MAIPIIPKDDYIKSVSLDALLQMALGALQEEEEQQSIAYAVATSGRHLCSENYPTGGLVFQAIESILEPSVCTDALRDHINELARRAGMEATTGARHG